MNRKGFTLIELLVVIAIIAILAAILFPVFASAKNTAKMRVCTSNLKQMGTAFRLYCDDYNGFSIPNNGSGDVTLDPTQIAPYAKSSVQKANDPGAKKPWICPGDKVGGEIGQPAVYMKHWNGRGSSYKHFYYEGSRFDQATRETITFPAKPDQWYKPSRDLLFIDYLFHFHGKRDNNQAGNWSDADKLKVVNVCMLDGHVRAGTRLDRTGYNNDNTKFGAWAFAAEFDNPYSSKYNPSRKSYLGE